MGNTQKAEWTDYNEPVLSWLFIDGWVNHPAGVNNVRTVRYCNGNVTISQGNPTHLLGKAEMIGGDFRVIKKNYEEYSTLGKGAHHFSSHSDPMQNDMEHWYMPQNAVVHNITNGSSIWPNVVPSSFSELDAKGATAIARCKPTKPVFNSAAFIGELREGLPSTTFQTWKERTARARGAGSDYLNYQFAWKPLVNDIRNFEAAAFKSQDLMKKYHKESNKLIHRAYSFPEERNISRSQAIGVLPQPVIDFDVYHLRSGWPKLDVTVETYRKIWFEGAFKYYLPDPSDKIGRFLHDSQKRFGWAPTPEALWQLTPWSWAADWFSNAGDVISNYTDFASGNNLVMPYGYVMEHVRHVHTYELRGVRYKSYPGDHYFRQVFTHEVKSRRTATPFGFGLEFTDLSDRQKAILAALVLSRQKR